MIPMSAGLNIELINRFIIIICVTDMVFRSKVLILAIIMYKLPTGVDYPTCFVFYWDLVNPYSMISVAVCCLEIMISPSGLRPAVIENMNDSNPTTCTGFTSNNGRPAPMTFRVGVNDSPGVEINITLLVQNTSCSSPPLYVSPISDVAKQRWTGKWTTCPLLTSQSSGTTMTCMYNCQCDVNGGCEEIQVTHRPRTPQEISWSVCDISITGMLLSYIL